MLMRFDVCKTTQSKLEIMLKKGFKDFEHAWISKEWKSKLNLERYTFISSLLDFHFPLASSVHSPFLGFKTGPKIQPKSLYEVRDEMDLNRKNLSKNQFTRSTSRASGRPGPTVMFSNGQFARLTGSLMMLTGYTGLGVVPL